MEDSRKTASGAKSPRKAPAKKATKAPAKKASTENAKGSRAPRIPRTRPILPAEEPLIPQLESLIEDAVQAVPVEEPPPAPALAPVPRPHIPLWAHLVADPGYAPEHAAREAVRRLGPEASEWVSRMSARYPSAGADALARLAAAEAGRSAWRRAAGSATAGVLGSVATTGVLAHSRARLVLMTAGAYGLDPTHDDRAADILTLLRVPRLTQPGLAAARNTARIVGGLAARGLAARWLPFGAALAGGIQATTGLDDVARRAQAHYRDYKNERRSLSRV